MHYPQERIMLNNFERTGCEAKMRHVQIAKQFDGRFTVTHLQKWKRAKRVYACNVLADKPNNFEHPSRTPTNLPLISQSSFLNLPCIILNCRFLCITLLSEAIDTLMIRKIKFISIIFRNT